MPHKQIPTAEGKVLAIVAMVLILVSGALAAPKYQVLHAFSGGNDGGGLWSSLLLDQRGNIYGTTVSGGPKGKGGTVFQLSRQDNGTWSQTVLYSFCSHSECWDGGGPTAGLILDTAGNLYGTTQSGGTHVYGTVFELTPNQHGTWSETVLYDFPLPSGGCCPYGGVAMGKSGNLYGATYSAFELTPGSSGWTATILHNFTGRNGDGSGPYAGPILDAAGRLYGTTERGGAYKAGTVYELRHSSGRWKELLLHSFPAFHDDGQVPGVGALASDQSGNLYGTTNQGGSHTCINVGCGTVFKLSPGSSGDWQDHPV